MCMVRASAKDHNGVSGQPGLPLKAMKMSAGHTAAKGHVSVRGPAEISGHVDGFRVTTEGHIEVHSLGCLKPWQVAARGRVVSMACVDSESHNGVRGPCYSQGLC